MSDKVAHFPDQVPIDAYGNYGFRFSGMSHQGSMLALPSGMYDWVVDSADKLTEDDFEPILGHAMQIGFVIVGTGPKQVWPDIALRHTFDERKIGLEIMDTGAAVRTYNVLLMEKRPVAAALIAVERP